MQSPIQPHIDNLLRDLREGATEQRQVAAKNLRNCGSAAVEPLCLALRDKDLNVRAAAAESLGHIGDERAVQALVEALRGCFIGQSTRWQLVIGGIAILIILIAAIRMQYPLFGKIGGLLLPLLLVFQMLVYNGKRISQSIMLPAITKALTLIAERTPTPELRNVLPDLKAITADVLQQSKTTRAASRQAAQRIEALTEQLKNLPLPAAAPVPDADTLPRVADAPAPNVETLPRVVDE